MPAVVAALQFLQTRSGDVWIGGWKNEVVRFSYSYNQWATYEDLNVFLGLYSPPLAA